VESSPKTNRKGSGSLDNVEVSTNLNFVEGPIFKLGLNPDFSTSKIEVSLQGIDYGFEDSTYPAFYELISAISEHPSFKESLSRNFIESKTILWLATVYKDKRARYDLVSCLQIEKGEAVESLTFYYPVINVHVSRSFSIGDVNISFFSKEYFDRLWIRNTKKDRTEEQFNKLYRNRTVKYIFR
jgi:hypothetical protein